jgi:hypothetical protein
MPRHRDRREHFVCFLGTLAEEPNPWGDLAPSTRAAFEVLMADIRRHDQLRASRSKPAQPARAHLHLVKKKSA